jgi:CBS domain-containing protein
LLSREVLTSPRPEFNAPSSKMLLTKTTTLTTSAAREQRRMLLSAPRAPAALAPAPRPLPPTSRSLRRLRVRAAPFGGAAPEFPTPSPAPAAAPEPTVEELMDPHAPVLRADMPLRDAARVFLTTNSQSAPVVDGDGLLVGVLSEADLLIKSAGAPVDEHWLLPPVYVGILDATLSLRDQAAWKAEVDKFLARDVAHAMTGAAGRAGRGGGKKESGSDGPLVTARADEPVSNAAGRMARRKVNMLPVVDGQGKVLGALTRHDVLRGLYATRNPML